MYEEIILNDTIEQDRELENLALNMGYDLEELEEMGVYCD